MNKKIAREVGYKQYGNLFVMKENFNDIVSECWCSTCDSFVKVKKQDLFDRKKTDCGKCSYNLNKKNTENHKVTREFSYIPQVIKRRFFGLLQGRINHYRINLTLEEYYEFSKIPNCHYCNKTIPWFSRSRAYYLDRKDNNIGYSVENCVVCCTRCNLSRGRRFTYEEWIQIGSLIKSWG